MYLYTCIKVYLYPGVYFVSMYPDVFIFMSPGVFVSMCPGVFVSTYPGVIVSMYLGVIVSMYQGVIVSMYPELKTLECDILNPDLLINLEIKFMRKTSNI